MTPASLRAELEAEYAWRRDEIRTLQNRLLSNVKDADERSLLRRPIILMLYAHYEGYVKFALKTYTSYVNSQRVDCKDAAYELMALSLNAVFTALDNADRKNKIFSRDLPDDSSLHRFSRRRDFVEDLDKFRNSVVNIEDDAVDTESNLWPIVLKKNLFRLGFRYVDFESFEPDVSHLLQRRNNIAHGQDRKGMDDTAYNKLQNAILKLMEDLTEKVFEFAKGSMFLQSRRDGIPPNSLLNGAAI